MADEPDLFVKQVAQDVKVLLLDNDVPWDLAESAREIVERFDLEWCAEVGNITNSLLVLRGEEQAEAAPTLTAGMCLDNLKRLLVSTVISYCHGNTSSRTVANITVVVYPSEILAMVTSSIVMSDVRDPVFPDDTWCLTEPSSDPLSPDDAGYTEEDGYP